MTFTITKTLIVLVSLWSLVLHHTDASGHTIQARVQNLCNNKDVTNPGLCYKTILPGVEGLARFNRYKAVEVEMLATKKQVEQTMGLMGSLIAKPGTSNYIINSLKSCQKQYDSILDTIEESLKPLGMRQAYETRVLFGSAISFQQACKDEFMDEPEPIANESQALFDLAANCLDLLKGIEDKENRRRPVPIPVTTPSISDPSDGPIGICHQAP